MDRILEAHYAQPNRTAVLPKEKVDIRRKSREMQDPRSVRATQAKNAKPLEKNRVDAEFRGKGVEKSGRER